MCLAVVFGWWIDPHSLGHLDNARWKPPFRQAFGMGPLAYFKRQVLLREDRFGAAQPYPESACRVVGLVPVPVREVLGRTTGNDLGCESDGAMTVGKSESRHGSPRKDRQSKT